MKNRGFTLIELLVVVGIIALLAALLAPTAGKMIERGRQARCGSNLRQVFSAVQAFAADSDGLIVRGGGANVPVVDDYYLWSDALVSRGYMKYVNISNYGVAGARPTGVFACPSSAALCNGGARSDYASNYFVNGELREDGSNGNFRMSSVVHLARVIAFIESAKGDGGCNRSVASWINAQTWGVAFRHQEHANAVFFDGHVESLRKDDLLLLLSKSSPEQKLPWSPTANL